MSYFVFVYIDEVAPVQAAYGSLPDLICHSSYLLYMHVFVFNLDTFNINVIQFYIYFNCKYNF